MDNDFNLIQALQDDWDAVSDAPCYRVALGRWQQSEPGLGGFESPAEVVRWCRSHPDPKDANPPVGALLRVAADPVAARTLLQVILPGLSVRVGRAVGKEDTAAGIAREHVVIGDLLEELGGGAGGGACSGAVADDPSPDGGGDLVDGAVDIRRLRGKKVPVGKHFPRNSL